MHNALTIRGARQHNLKNVTLSIPKDALVVFTGVSGSGKSSLAFDTIYAEGQRRYVESLSSYARQFLGIMDKPDVDGIDGLSPAISIDQKSTSHNPRSTVGTVTEIYDYLRLLYARVGHPHCPSCGREIARQSKQQIVTNIVHDLKEQSALSGKRPVRVLFMSPIVRDRKGEFSGLFSNIRAKGYRMVRVDGTFVSVDEDLYLIKTNKHSVDAVIDRITLDAKTIKLLLSDDPKDKDMASTMRTRITDAVEQALALSQGLVIAGFVGDASFDMPEKPKSVTDKIYSEQFACPVCNISISEIEPRSFSFNTPHGACPSCGGIGSILTVDPMLVIAPSLTLSEGAVIPFARMFYHDTWYSRVISTVAEANGIDITKPIGSYPKEKLDILLHGTGTTQYLVKGTNRFGEKTAINETFEGIITELKRRHSQTDSEFVRNEIEKYMTLEVCQACQGKRLKQESLTVTIANRNIAETVHMNIEDAAVWFSALLTNTRTLSSQELQIATPILKEIIARLRFLIDVGLDYLTLDRPAMSLSGGEAQRIRLASQIGSGLSGVLYVLDEPSIGLHPRDNVRLIRTLTRLRDLGNTVIVVEHDKEMMLSSDHIVDFGPGAGNDGGNVVAQGTPKEFMSTINSLTSQYLKETKKIRRAIRPIDQTKGAITLRGASMNNLKDVTVTFPLGAFIAVTGVSGSGKSTLVVETLYKSIYRHFNPFTKEHPGEHDRVDGLEHIDKVILIDQSPIGRTPRSNPATYTGLFTAIRDLFSQIPEAKQRGFTPGRFSFNVKGGRCEACEGEGQKRIEMQFLSDVYVTCEVCGGTRYSQETLDIEYKGKNIAQVLAMSIDEATEYFTHIPALFDKLSLMRDVGLGYMKLGQSATTLSGGEAQRVKLATELMRRSTGKTLYILDEPTTGLHFADLEKLLSVLSELTKRGNTVLVIEHNLDVIRNADWILDLGPEGGDKGGQLIAEGTPSDVARHTASHTGQFLKNILQ